MTSKTSAPESASAGAFRRSQNELMRQWRRRGVLQLVSGLTLGVWVLALVLDGAALTGGLLLAGADRLLPGSARVWLNSGRLETWRPDISDVYVTSEGRAGLISLAAVVCLMLSLNFQARFRRLAAGLYGLGWLGLLACLGLGGQAVVSRLQRTGIASLSEVDDWLLWGGLVTLVLGMILEGCTRRGWCLLATALAGGLLVLAGVAWPEEPFPLVIGTGASPVAMLVPGVLLLAGYGGLAVGWMLGMLGLACVLARPGRVEPLASVVYFACRCLQVGLLLASVALLLDGSWIGQGQAGLVRIPPRVVWALAPLGVAALVLLCRMQGTLPNQGLAVLIVAGFSALVLGWSVWHGGVGMIAVAGWVGLVNLCLALHAGQRYLSYRPGV